MLDFKSNDLNFKIDNFRIDTAPSSANSICMLYYLRVCCG